MTTRALPSSYSTAGSLRRNASAGKEIVTSRQSRRRRRRLGPGPAWRYGRTFGPLALLALWSIACLTGVMDPRVLPSPWSVVEAARSLILDGRLQTNLEVSVLRAFEGLAYGAISGTVVALLAGLTRAGEYAFDGVVEIKRSLPAIALIPLLMLWLGIGEPMKVTVIAIGVFAQVYLPVHAALRGIDAKYVELAETLSVGRLSFLRNVVLPGALPGLFMGLRLGVNAAWLGLIVVEQINATSGIGYMITLAGTYGQTDVVILGLCLYGLLGLLSDALVRFLQRRALSWQRTLAS